MDRGRECTFFPKNIRDQQTHEKILNTPYQEGNGNPSHNEISPPICPERLLSKNPTNNKRWQGCGKRVTLILYTDSGYVNWCCHCRK